ncbi:hypothetical protein HF086_012783 [Spodoptera exigua]|uniref:MADF domain-containing protein n=1 Tax=Spodoptera exigua TaxID=7107 RepID=A0A922MK86_SPOEX|nr:hypothetical protein HF086_012783 [Spodoptera exigua]
MAVNTESFISAIQSKPPIWQSKHPHHNNRTITRKLWSEIKEQFPGSEEKQLRKKWKNLRDQYRKEKKKFPTPRSGDGGDEVESTWPYFQLMQFINDDITPEVMTGNLHDSDDSESLNESCQTEQYNIADVMSLSASTCSSRTSASKRNKSASDYRDELIECQRKKILLIEQKMASNSEQPEKCDDYYFFISLVPQMKKFSELQKLRIRNKISQIIHQTERMQFPQPRYEENYGGYSTDNYPNY